MRTCLAIGLAACAALLAAGCGERGPAPTPVACLEGRTPYLHALEDAPGPVRLRGETPIGDCLVENQEPGELATVGEAMVLTATTLNMEGRTGSRKAAEELGYLLGAAKRGAERTEGIHSDLVRRLTVAAQYSPGEEPLDAAFLAAYRRGFDAGHADG
jgi:hypothetical protein